GGDARGTGRRSGNADHDGGAMSRPHALPGALVDDWEWPQQGLCRGVDSSVFSPPDGEPGHARRRRAQRAKPVGAPCPVPGAGREHALALAEPYGIWGGMSESERMFILKKRRNAQSRPATAEPARADTAPRTQVPQVHENAS